MSLGGYAAVNLFSALVAPATTSMLSAAAPVIWGDDLGGDAAGGFQEDNKSTPAASAVADGASFTVTLAGVRNGHEGDARGPGAFPTDTRTSGGGGRGGSGGGSKGFPDAAGPPPAGVVRVSAASDCCCCLGCPLPVGSVPSENGSSLLILRCFRRPVGLPRQLQ